MVSFGSPGQGAAATAVAARAAAAAAAGAGAYGGSSTAISPFSFDPTVTGADHRELLSLMAQVDALQAKLKWIDHCCAFRAWGQLSWQQLAVLTVGFHPFPPLSILWVRRLVARTSLMLLLPVQPPFPPKPSSMAAVVAACRVAAPATTAAAACGGGGEDDEE